MVRSLPVYECSRDGGGDSSNGGVRGGGTTRWASSAGASGEIPRAGTRHLPCTALRRRGTSPARLRPPRRACSRQWHRKGKSFRVC